MGDIIVWYVTGSMSDICISVVCNLCIITGPWVTFVLVWCVLIITGPWVTFEIQLPQDDFNLLAWVLGSSPVAASDLAQLRQDYQLRGLHSHQQLLNGGWG